MGRSVKVYRSRTRGLRVGNFGDELMAPLLERLFGLKVMHVGMRHAELIGVGSILDTYARHHPLPQGAVGRLLHRLRPSAPVLHVWGAGAMVEGTEFTWPQALNIHAVRGPLTAARIPGFRGAIGDPGILAPRIVAKPSEPTSNVVLVPHFVDQSHVDAMELPRHWRVVHPDGPVPAVLSAIAGAELVVSSSLHGLIVADAYGIPAVWAQTRHPLAGRNSTLKFRDHAAARRSPFNDPITYAEAAAVGGGRLVALSSVPRRSLPDWQAELVAAFPRAAFA